MADSSTAARPYARAVFDLANQRGALKEWSETLEFLTHVVTNDRVRTMIGDPRVTRDKLADAIVGIGLDRLANGGDNFVRILSENDRLEAVPAIWEQYELLKADAERVVEVTLRSALPVPDEHRERIAAAMRKRFGREIRMHTEIDESLVGGAVIEAGDTVIDGSVRARINHMAGILAR